MYRIVLAGLVSLLPIARAVAQDPVKVDAKHYKIVFENDRVRVLRIQYGAHEKSVMHDHPDSVAIFLTDHQVKFTYPDGKTEEGTAKAGESRWIAAGKHLPENTSGKPWELILVEMKSPRRERAEERSGSDQSPDRKGGVLQQAADH
jgi:quercetin dioxygenase-like cupin family protein